MTLTEQVLADTSKALSLPYLQRSEETFAGLERKEEKHRKMWIKAQG